MRTSAPVDLNGKDPLRDPQGETFGIEREVMEVISQALVKKHNIPTSRQPEARNAVAGFWIKEFGPRFRESCCGGADMKGLKADLYDAMKGVTNGARIDLVLVAMGFVDLKSFLARETQEIECALVQEGIISAVGEKVSGVI